MRFIAFSIVFIVGCALWAQPTFNKRYTFGSKGSSIYSVSSNDSCYFISGGMQALDGDDQINFFLNKIDFTGNIIQINEFDFDTIWSSQGTYTRLTKTNTNHLITSIHFYDYTGVFLFDANTDSIWGNIFEEIYFEDSKNTASNGLIIQNPEDSSYTTIQTVYDVDTYDYYLQIINLSKNGEINFVKTILTEVPDYDYFRALSFTRVSDGYVIACNRFKDLIEEQDRYQMLFIKTDLLGNVVTQKTLTDNPYEYAGTGLTQTSDGGFIYGGVVGYWGTSAIEWKNYIVKLDEDLNKEWGLTVPGYHNSQEMIYKILDLGDDEYLAIGSGLDNWDFSGVMFKFNLDREILWDSYFHYVPRDTYTPFHKFYDVAQTPDGGFILVGDIDDDYSGFVSDTTYYSWIVKTDSFGCLVPGCQDVLSTNPSAVHFKFSIYPNPTTDYLNLYYNTATFSENTTAELYSIQGQLLQSWRLSQNNTTYMLDIQGIPPGTYVLNLIENGSLLQSEKVVIGG